MDTVLWKDFGNWALRICVHTALDWPEYVLSENPTSLLV